MKTWLRIAAFRTITKIDTLVGRWLSFSAALQRHYFIFGPRETVDQAEFRKACRGALAIRKLSVDLRDGGSKEVILVLRRSEQVTCVEVFEPGRPVKFHVYTSIEEAVDRFNYYGVALERTVKGTGTIEQITRSQKARNERYWNSLSDQQKAWAIITHTAPENIELRYPKSGLPAA